MSNNITIRTATTTSSSSAFIVLIILFNIVAVVETVKLTNRIKTSLEATSTSSSSSSPAVQIITNEKSKQFLQQKSLDPDVKILHPSKLQYKIIRTGNGEYHPEYDSPTVYHYEGRLIDDNNNDNNDDNDSGSGSGSGTIFDSTYQRGRPAYYQPRQTLPCFAEAMQLMVEGDIWELYVPPQLAYGAVGSDDGLIVGGDAVIFKVEMIEIKGTKVKDQFLVRCDIHNVEKNCTEREMKYVITARDRFEVKNISTSSSEGGSGGVDATTSTSTTDRSAIEAEIERIKKVSKKGSDKVIDWSNRRIRILNQFKNKGTESRSQKPSQAGTEL